MSLVYPVAATVVVIFVWMLIRRIPEKTNGIMLGIPGVTFLSILLMVKIRCKFEPYPCGFMSFTGGFTWHIFIGLGILPLVWFILAVCLNNFTRKGIIPWIKMIGFWLRPLLGLSIGVVWYILPVSVIHPPTHGGPCPNIPIICHDLPLLGFGGLFYWTMPFVIWTTITVLNGIRIEFGNNESTRVGKKVRL